MKIYNWFWLLLHNFCTKHAIQKTSKWDSTFCTKCYDEDKDNTARRVKNVDARAEAIRRSR